LPEREYIPALGYGALTPLYDAVVRCTTRERRFKQALIRQARLRAGHRILDLATGTGTLAIWIKESEPAANVTGVDIDRAILARAARKATRAGADVRFDRARSDALPYPDASFDRVLSSLFFHHLAWPDKIRTAREVFRVLRPNGELHVADWGRPANALMRGLFVTVQCLDGFETTRDNVAGRLISLFVQTGFAEVRDLQSVPTMLGTLALYIAVKPAGADLASSAGDTPPGSRKGTEAAP
jgi:SAM-dependent methyltransferase